MANTFIKIASVTVGSGGTASIDFTSIPQTYTDLCVFASLRSADPENSRANIEVTLNGSNTGYSQRLLFGSDGTAGSASNALSSMQWFFANKNGTTASTFSNGTIYIPNYAGSNNKSVALDSVTENNSTTGSQLAMTAGFWSNTSAITSIKLKDTNSFNLLQYSTATLYGISNT